MSRSQRYRRRRRGSGRHRSQALLGLMVVVIVLGIGGLSVVGWVVATAASAPELSSLKARDPGSNTEVLAADGTRLGFISADDLSRPVSGKQLPKMLRDATVAIEDERFYRHKGVDYESIVRAAVENFASRETVQGGSTLTMQLVKNLYTADRARSGPGRLQAQDPRGQARRGARERARQGVDPRALPEHRAVRDGRGPDRHRRRGRRPHLLQQARQEAEAARGGDCSPAFRRRRRCTRRSPTGRPPSAAATRCWPRWPSSG